MKKQLWMVQKICETRQHL